jgi:hypothetical protein
MKDKQSMLIGIIMLLWVLVSIAIVIIGYITNQSI